MSLVVAFIYLFFLVNRISCTLQLIYKREGNRRRIGDTARREGDQAATYRLLVPSFSLFLVLI